LKNYVTNACQNLGILLVQIYQKSRVNQEPKGGEQDECEYGEEGEGECGEEDVGKGGEKAKEGATEE
jgi:hypothetical protein